jgi:hypothetical protein
LEETAEQCNLKGRIEPATCSRASDGASGLVAQREGKLGRLHEGPKWTGPGWDTTSMSD